MTIDETNTLHEKATKKKDGVYSFRGYLWAVKNNKFVAFANQYGECYQRMGSFNYQIGQCDRFERKKKLIDWLKRQ